MAIKQLSSSLVSLRSCIACEFSRKPRSIIEFTRFKATELRQLMLYTGPIVLKKYLSNDCFNHYMTFNIAMTILLSDGMDELVNYARDLLESFVKNFELLYGKHLVSHNVHCLLHLADDYESFGSLDNISAFPFENYMKNLKKMLRKHDKPLQQVIKRYYEQIDQTKNTNYNSIEEISFKKENSEGPLILNLSGPQYHILCFKSITVKVKKNADRFILTKFKKIFEVVNIVHIK